MPVLKRSTSSVEERKPFGVYDGPPIPRGNYPAVVRSVVLRTSKNGSGNQYLNVLTELESPEDSAKAIYNGAPIYTMITLTDDETNMAREQAFYRAICGKADVDIVTDDAKPAPNVTKIGGKVPAGVAVRVDVRLEEYPAGSGTYNPKGDTIYAGTPSEKTAARKAEVSKDPDADPDATTSGGITTHNITVEAEKPAAKTRTGRKLAAVPDTDSEEAAAPGGDVDFRALPLMKLRAFATENGVDPAGLTKAAIIGKLEDKLESAPEPASDGKPTPETVTNWGEDQFVLFLQSVDYEPGDFEGMTRAESIEVLVEDGVVLPF